MTKILGLTGGIGSGKTTVSKIFTALGVPVYNADDEAKVLMQSSKKIKSKIIELFGEKSYFKNGLNRSYIAQIVFKDKEKLKALNAIVHPEVTAHFNTWKSLQSHPYVVKEVAILFEIGAQDQFDFILTITAPQQTRIDRVMLRDNKSYDEVLSIIQNQWSDTKKIEKSDYVIQNIDINQTKIEVIKINEKINEKILKNS
jgi:dephospho-CoA kinase